MRARAVRWWQIVDLLARSAPAPPPELVERALAALRADRESVDETVRTATARSLAGLRLRADLVALFAEDGLAVAGPLLVAAQLDPAGWSEVLATARPEVRALLAATRPDVFRAETIVASSAAIRQPAEPVSISEMIERIAELPDAEPQPTTPSPPPPAARPPLEPRRDERLFRWECDPAGQIGWVDARPRGPLIGRSLARSGSPDGVDRQVAEAFTRRAPFRGAPLRIASGALAGEWQLSGLPAFDPADGRFCGYRGIAEREGAGAGPPAPAGGTNPALAAILHDSDAMRELVHEIRTPLNAIIGFAEIIEGQYLGPAHRHYRDRAGHILRQARTLLEAVEDLDLAARLHAARADRAPGEPLAALLAVLVEESSAALADRRIALKLDRATSRLAAKVDGELARRLVGRLLKAATDAADDGETLRLSASAGEAGATVTIGRPKSTAGHGDEQLFDPAFAPRENGSDALGLGFALRLLRGLASAAGGELAVDAAGFALTLPLAAGE